MTAYRAIGIAAALFAFALPPARADDVPKQPAAEQAHRASGWKEYAALLKRERQEEYQRTVEASTEALRAIRYQTKGQAEAQEARALELAQDAGRCANMYAQWRAFEKEAVGRGVLAYGSSESWGSSSSSSGTENAAPSAARSGQNYSSTASASQASAGQGGSSLTAKAGNSPLSGGNSQGRGGGAYAGNQSPLRYADKAIDVVQSLLESDKSAAAGKAAGARAAARVGVGTAVSEAAGIGRVADAVGKGAGVVASLGSGLILEHIDTKLGGQNQLSTLDEVIYQANRATGGAVKGALETIGGAAKGTAETIGGVWDFLTGRR